jgi:hypothetical protein
LRGSVLVLMSVEVLYEVAEAEIGVSHGGRRDPKLSGKPDYMSVDEEPEDLTNHCGGTRLMKGEYFHEAFAEHRNNLLIFLKWGPAGSRLEGGAEHDRCCRLCRCTDLEKLLKGVTKNCPRAALVAMDATDGFWVMTTESARCSRLEIQDG